VSAQTGQRASPGRWLAIVASVVVIATVVCALVAIGPPAQQRRMALDARRAHELSTLSNLIDMDADRAGKLPAALADLEGAGQWLSIKDPDNGAPYEYAITGDTTYRLCAVFATATQSADAGGGWGDGEWSHPAGRHCFDRKAKTK
jgi:hypothetical protein